MIARRTASTEEPLSDQVAARLAHAAEPAPAPADNRVISTGSTLLDLAISGGRFPEGGVPPGIMVEIFGPSGCGKTVLLCEIAGNVQRLGGDIMFRDPEGRLNTQFASMFGLDVNGADYSQPNTVPELFAPIREWQPKSNGINAVFADSLAALSTDMEMKDGDKFGMRRAKEFSEECRKTCRVLVKRGFLMVCSNQVRGNPEAGPFAEKYTTPGGLAIGFYSSLRLRAHSARKLMKDIEIRGKKHQRVIGVETMFDVYKSSIWKPHHAAPVYIQFDYGIDDIRANLVFIKEINGGTMYSIGDRSLDQGLERSIQVVEKEGLDGDLKRRTIELWHDLEDKFRIDRRPKIRR